MTATTAILDSAGTDSPAGVLAAVRGRGRRQYPARPAKLELAVEWARMHSTDSIHEAATLWDGRGEDTGVPVAGVGAPLVAEFSICEFAAALGVPTQVGKALPGGGARAALPAAAGVAAGAGRAGAGVAGAADRPALTIALTPEAAAYVDRHVGPVAHKVGPVQTERLVAEAIARHMPETAEEIRRKAADGRHFTIDHDQVSFAGTSLILGEVDLADALDLDDAIAARAARLKDLGCTESLDVRRAIAVGELARHQQAFDLPSNQPAIGGRVASASERIETRRQPRRQVVLYVHLHQSAIAGPGRRWAGSRTPGTGRSPPNRSAPGAATRTRTWW